jgi:hypothetical protein
MIILIKKNRLFDVQMVGDPASRWLQSQMFEPVAQTKQKTKNVIYTHHTLNFGFYFL